MIEWLLAVFYYGGSRMSGDFFNRIGQKLTAALNFEWQQLNE
jgi:hypothetical protein